MGGLMVNLAGKVVVFCLPGATYSGRFLKNMLALQDHLLGQGAIPVYEQHYRSLVHYSRFMCLNSDPATKKPFLGMPYDYVMWIDSDIVFTVDNFVKLVNHDKDIMTGWYASPIGKDGELATSVYDQIDAGQNHSVGVEEMKGLTEPFRIAGNGLGWTLMKSGVLEKMPYPWFVPKMLTMNGKKWATSEDIMFFIDAHLAGYEIWVDPTIRVGHEKITVL
jgi:hypothetical protein